MPKTKTHRKKDGVFADKKGSISEKSDGEYPDLVQRYETLLSGLTQAVMAVDASGHIIYMNPAADRMLGLDFRKVSGKVYHKLWGLRDENGKTVTLKDRPIQFSERTGLPYETDKFEVMAPGLEPLPVAISVKPISLSKGAKHFLVMYRDITQEKRINRIKDEFISLASHQLRTPLSVIKWYSEILESDRLGKLNEKQQANLREIKANNQRLIDLVEALLIVAKIDQGKYIPVPKVVDVGAAVRRVLAALAPTINQKRLKLRFSESNTDGPIKIDPQMLDVVLQTLLSNAVDYSREGGEFGYKTLADGKRLKIEVWDSGYGIPAEEQPKLFAKFFRGSNARRVKPNGTGLGLYIVKSLVEAAGGSVNFKSKENAGTSFAIILPFGLPEKKS
ncbi:MAG: PAS domain-containing sensor histidine kinase [Patescibacteria group bacterium]